MKKLLSLLLACLLLAGCASNAVSEPPAPVAAETEKALASIAALGGGTVLDDNYRTWYEIFVYSFCDSNGDGIGDINGVISKLDHLTELGVNGIWLMPIHPSQSYHKYDVADYYDIDPAYGTLEDFRNLLAECEARDIHVITDLVLNHSANNHEWFLTACDYLRSLPAGAEPDPAECPYVDYYYFSREQEAPYYYEVTGSEWYYEGKFSPDMPDLNLANQRVRQEISDIMAYWLDMGVSGFRLDAVKEFYSGNTPANIEVLSWIQQEAVHLKEDVYLVAEAWDGFGAVCQYYSSGLMSFFNFPLGTSDGVIIDTVRAAGRESAVKNYAVNLEKCHAGYVENNPDYIDAPFLSNHDVGRIASFCNRDEYKTKMAGAMNLLMSGSAFIYYGEEIGMLGGTNDPSKRAPMYWNAARDNGTTNPPPGCELPESYPFGSLEEQLYEDGSVYNYYRQLVAVRKALPVVTHGVVSVEQALNAGCVSAQRKTWGEEECIILMNVNTEAAQVDLSGYADWTLAVTLSANGEPIAMEGTNLNMAAFGIAILLPEA